MAKERWASRVGLVLAMAGNAVGLGNFLRFPAQAAKNGGGAFLIPYLVALLIVGLPLIWMEWAMGRFGGQRGHHSTPGIFDSLGKSGFWKYFGVMGLWSCLVIASYYLYIESWCLAYMGYSAIGGFSGMNVGQVTEFFNRDLTGQQDFQIIAISGWGMALFAICVAVNLFIVSRGLAKGIELVAKIGMPILIVFAAVLAVRGLMIQPTDPGVKESPLVGLNFVWEPKFDSLADPAVWLAAAGQIFFTLSIGMGSIHCYASYLRQKDDVALTGATAGWTNEFCEVILGGTILIPIAVAYLGLQEVQARTAGGSGFSLGFFVFPTLFNNWGWFAPVAGFMWFGLLFFAAITSSLAMAQPIMAFFQHEFGLSRERSAGAFGLCLLPLALLVALFHSGTFNDEFDYWAGTVMLVVFAFGETVLFAWVFGMGRAWEQINLSAELKVPVIFRFTMQYITPVFLALILAGFLFKPAAGWTKYFQAWTSGQPAPAWEWASDGMIGKLLHLDLQRESAATLKPLEQLEQELKTLPDNDPRRNELPEVSAKVAKARTFFADLGWWRNVDRLVLVGVYLLFSGLVFIAWRRRRKEGKVTT